MGKWILKGFPATPGPSVQRDPAPSQHTYKQTNILQMLIY